MAYSVLGAVAAVFLGSLLDPVFSPVTSQVRKAFIRAYEHLPFVPAPASEAERHLACLSGESTAKWGPPRRFYHWAHPAPSLTMNSIADNPKWGFEGTFIRVRHAHGSKWCLRVAGDVGDELEFLVYVENSSASNRALFTNGLRLRVRKGAFGGRTVVRAYISSTNSSPQAVWSDAAIDGAPPRGIVPTPDSARIVSNYYKDTGFLGPSIPGDVWSARGALIGPQLSQLGRLSGSAADSFYIDFRATVAPAFTTGRAAP